MSQTTHIRVKPKVKKEIIRIRRIYVKQLYELGKDKEKIAKISEDGLSQGEFVEVLLDYWKERETKQ